MTLAERLSAYDEKYWDFSEYRNYVRYIKDNSGLICLKCGDSKELLGALDANSVDLICTSPPYGDNHTTVTYGQFSILPCVIQLSCGGK